eukprot:gene14006-16510_t
MKTLYQSCLILFLFLISISAATAQSAKVKGTIIEKSNGQPLPFASVLLIHLPDSLKNGVQMSNEKGQFTFTTVREGKYILKVIAVGYTTSQSQPFLLAHTDLNLPALSLSTDVRTLNEVNIQHKLPVVNYQADRTVLNVEQMNTAGDNTLEVLQKAPGIRLDKDDNLIFKGKSGVNVMIDGKMSYMSGTELNTYLKSLPASVLSKIELISNPPASFDAAGSAGIINIILKRNKMQGSNGSVTAGIGQGKYEKANGSILLNNNTGKISTYVRLSAGRYNSYNRLTMNRQIGDEQFNQVNYWHPQGMAYNYAAGADYFMTERHTLGIQFKGFTEPEKTMVNSNSVNYNAAGQQAGRVEMTNPQRNQSGNSAFNLNYRFKIDTAGRELNFDANYVNYNNNKNETFVNTYFTADNNLAGPAIDLRNNGNGSVSIYALKIDYKHPFSKSLLMEAGWKSSWVDSKSDLKFDSLKTQGWIQDPRRTNLFLYKENINALYTSFSKSFDKVELKAGLRAEQTIGNGSSSGTVSDISRKYLQLFPSAFLTWKVTADHLLNSSYTRRINRPSYGSLNPFTFYTDPYTAIQGNPMLLPSFSNSYELNYSYKNFRVLNISYAKTNQDVTTVIYQNDVSKQSISKYENLGQTTSLYFATGSPFDVTKWWNTNNDLSIAFDRTRSAVQGGNYNFSRWSWSISSDNNFTLPKDYVLNIYSSYNSPSVSGLFKTLAAYTLNVGVKKTLMNKNATLSFKVNDVFATSRFRGILQYNNVNTYWQNEWESRRVSLSFSYKFGNMKLKTARNRKTGTSEEEGRVGQ